MKQAPHAFVGREQHLAARPDQLFNEIQRQLVHVDSRNVGGASNYKVYLKTPIENVVRVELVNGDLPIVVPNVTAVTGRMTFEENGEERTFMVPTGHYGVLALAEEVQRIMNDRSELGGGYIVSFLSSRGRMHVTCNNNAVAQFGIRLCPLGKLMGFTSAQASTDPKPGVDPADEFYERCLVSDAYVNLNASSFVYLSVAEIDHSYTDVSYDRENVEGVPTFAKIYTPVELGSYLTYHYNEYPVFREFSKPMRRLDSLTIRWMNSDFTPLEFEGLPHSFTLMFTTMDAKI